MGSGCISSSTNGSFFEKRTPDTAVVYTGDPIPSLGICKGDRLDEIEAVILSKLIAFAQGKQIFISDIDLTLCGLFVDDIVCCNATGPKELDDLMVTVFNALCKLYTDLEEVKEQLTDLLGGPYNTSCLTGLPTNPTLKNILQQLLIEFCALKASVASLSTLVNTFITNIGATIGNFLGTHLTSCQGVTCLNKIGTGASTQIELKGFAPVGAILAFHATPITMAGKFDATGLGVSGTDACGWAICNGNYGTPNMMGLTIVGATDMPGGTPPSGAPSMPNNSTGGFYSTTLTAAQSGMPSHTHTYTEPNSGQGHSHKIKAGRDKGPNPGTFDGYAKDDANTFESNLDGAGPNGSIAWYIKNSPTGIAINSTPAQNAAESHDNRMPYKALYYIQRIN